MPESNHAAGSWVSTRGQHDNDNSPQRTQLPIASPSPPPAAAVSPFRHQRNLRVHTHVRGATPLHMPPGRTTVEDLIRVPSHGLSHAAGLQHGSPTTGDEAHQSTHSAGVYVQVPHVRSTGHRFLAHLPAHLEINHRPGLPEFLTHAVDECPGTLAPVSDSRESRWRVLA